MFHGRGKFTSLVNGEVSEGMYYKNLPRGDYKLTFPSGSVFEGIILQNLNKSLDSYEAIELEQLPHFCIGKIFSSDGQRHTLVNNQLFFELTDPFATTANL